MAHSVICTLKELTKKLLFLAITWYITHFTFLNFHEAIHQEIFAAYHCSSIHTRYYTFGLEAHTCAICPERNDDMVFLHALNEIIGYTITGLYTILYFNLALLLIYRTLRGEYYA